MPIPLDHVDEEYLSRPRQWDMKFIRNFMLLVGPVSSVFDFLMFLHHAGACSTRGQALFHTGWFIESMATQVLVIFIIRTRRNPFKSRPNPWLVACSLTVVAVAVVLPFTPAGVHLGFVAPPAVFFLILIRSCCWPTCWRWRGSNSGFSATWPQSDPRPDDGRGKRRH